MVISAGEYYNPSEFIRIHNTMGREEASTKIHRCGGVHSDPDLVRAFLEALKEKEKLFRAINDHPGGYQKAS